MQKQDFCPDKILFQSPLNYIVIQYAVLASNKDLFSSNFAYIRSLLFDLFFLLDTIINRVTSQKRVKKKQNVSDLDLNYAYLHSFFNGTESILQLRC